MRTTRWAMIGVGLVAGIVLIAAGATLAGTVIAGLAVVRGVVMLTMGRRMAHRAPGHRGGPVNRHLSNPSLSRTAPQGWVPPPPAAGSLPAPPSDPTAPGWAAPVGSPGAAAPIDPGRSTGGGTDARPLQRLARRELGVAASAIGIDAAELQRQRQAGRSIAEVAADHGVAVDQVVGVVAADATSTIERARRNGNPAAIGADTTEARVTTWVRRFVEQRGAPDHSS